MSDRIIGGLLVGGCVSVTRVFMPLITRVLVGIAGIAMLMGWWARTRRGAEPGMRRLGDALLILAGAVAAFFWFVQS